MKVIKMILVYVIVTVVLALMSIIFYRTNHSVWFIISLGALISWFITPAFINENKLIKNN